MDILKYDTVAFTKKKIPSAAVTAGWMPSEPLIVSPSRAGWFGIVAFQLEQLGKVVERRH